MRRACATRALHLAAHARLHHLVRASARADALLDELRARNAPSQSEGGLGQWRLVSSPTARKALLCASARRRTCSAAAGTLEGWSSPVPWPAQMYSSSSESSIVNGHRSQHRRNPPSTRRRPDHDLPSPDARQQTSIAMEGVDNFSFGVLSIAIDSYQSFSPRNPVSYVGRSKATHWVRLAHQRNPAGESYHW